MMGLGPTTGTHISPMVFLVLSLPFGRLFFFVCSFLPLTPGRVINVLALEISQFD